MKNKLVALSLLLGAGVSNAALAAPTLPRAWVSATRGVDSPTCGLSTNPCKTFQYTLTNIVISSGTILVLDPGGYAPLTIDKPISIINDYVGSAGVFTNSGANAVTINLPSGGNVVLKGLTISGAGSVVTGVNMTSSGNLTMVDCTLTGFNINTAGAAAVNIAPSSGSTKVSIVNAFVSGNRNGVLVAPTGTASVSASVVGGTINGNLVGVLVNGSGSSGSVGATISDSVIQNNSEGVTVSGQSLGNPTQAIVKNVNASFNTVSGFKASTGGAMSFTNSTAVSNGADVSISGGAVSTFANNIFGQTVSGMSPATFQ